jgi:hypothetical protein
VVALPVLRFLDPKEVTPRRSGRNLEKKGLRAGAEPQMMQMLASTLFVGGRMSAVEKCAWGEMGRVRSERNLHGPDSNIKPLP